MAAALGNNLECVLEVAEDSDFSIHNIPFGVFRHRDAMDDGTQNRCATRIGDFVVDLRGLFESGFFNDAGFDASCFQESTLNSFMGLGREAWTECRTMLQTLLSVDEYDLNPFLVGIDEVEMKMPAHIGDYTDFYAGIHHATNVGTMFRGKENALKENWPHMPIGYHGRASSIVVSGTPITRPMGQTRNGPVGTAPVFEACTKMDFELELAFFYGGEGNAMGARIPIDEAEDHIFGVVLMNDWSARDIQKWEYVPLGPFNGKNYATTISPWIVTIDALNNFRYDLPTQNAKDVTPLPYLQGSKLTNYDLNLSAAIHPESGEEEQLSTVHGGESLYWTFSQLLCHHTSTGCPFRPGDLCGSGTISGPESRTEGSMLEISRAGKNPITLKDGSTRKYLDDGDTLILRGYCQNENGARIGFGECRGSVTPAV